MKKLLLVLPFFILAACDSEKKEDKDSSESENETVESVSEDSTPETETPKAILGDAVAMAIGTMNYDESVEFYKALGFDEQMSGERDGAKWIDLFDGSLMLSIMEEEEMTYVGPSYFTSSADVFTHLQDLGVEFWDNHDGSEGHAIVISPDSVGLSVMQMPMEMPETKNVSVMFASQDKSAIEYPNPVLGTFQEYAVTVEDINESIAYWEGLGFKSSGVMNGMYPYSIMYDGLMIIGLHEAGTMWYGSVLTYSGESIEKNEATVAMLKEKGYTVENLEFEGMDTSYLITDPDGNIVYLTADFKKEEDPS